MDKNTLDDADGLSSYAVGPEPMHVPIDLDKNAYQDELAEFDLNDAQKNELLETLWVIMGSFARMGFTVDVCGSIFGEFNEASATGSGDARMIVAPEMEAPSDDGGGER